MLRLPTVCCLNSRGAAQYSITVILSKIPARKGVSHMLRGAQKQMIVVRTHDSRVFEEACFVIRRGAVQAAADEGDMLKEANHIIETSLPPAMRSPRACRESASSRLGLLSGLVWFATGLGVGSGLVGLLWLIL